MREGSRILAHDDPGVPFTAAMVESYYIKEPLSPIDETVKRLNLFVLYGPEMRKLQAALGEADGATVVQTAYMFKDKMPTEYRSPRWDTMQKGSTLTRAVDEALVKQAKKHDRRVERMQAKLDDQPTATEADAELVYQEIIRKVSGYDKLEGERDLLLQENEALRAENKQVMQFKANLKELLG